MQLLNSNSITKRKHIAIEEKNSSHIWELMILAKETSLHTYIQIFYVHVFATAVT